MGYSEEKVSVRNGMFNVTVKRGGSGDPLVYLHAAGGQASWDPFLDMLAKDFEVIQPMHPGWPGSDGLEHLDDVVDLGLYYLDFFDALGLSSANLVGASLGGMFAAEIAALGPNYVRRLVLSEPAGLWLDDHQPMDMFAASQDEMMQAMFYDPEKVAASRPPVDTEDTEAVKKMMLDRQMGMAAAGKVTWPIWDKGLKKRLHRIKSPTLIVWGENDGLIPPVYGGEFQRLIPGSRLEVIPQSAHAPMIERPDEWSRIVTDFLKS